MGSSSKVFGFAFILCTAAPCAASLQMPGPDILIESYDNSDQCLSALRQQLFNRIRIIGEQNVSRIDYQYNIGSVQTVFGNNHEIIDSYSYSCRENELWYNLSRVVVVGPPPVDKSEK